MADRNTSRTALGTAYMRAAHQLLDATPRILEDPVAVKILGPAAEARIREEAAEYQTAERRALRAHVVLRSRFAEDRLAASLARGVRQYVILGAGFDTFALRQPAWARALRILEVDHPATQAMKCAKVAATGLVLPENLGFATIDFEQESLRDGLQRYAIRPEVPTFFSLLGVMMYLDGQAVDTLLGAVASFPAGSEIVLTFAPPPGDFPSPFAELAARMGEPWKSYFEPQVLAARLRTAGFTAVEFLSPAAAQARYFLPRRADLPAPQRTNIACAVR